MSARGDDDDNLADRPALPLLAGAAFAASVVAVLLTPWCTRDRVSDPLVWRAALARHVDLVKPRDTILVHPPWRDDVVAALRSTPGLPAGVVVTDVIAPRHGDPLPPLLIIRERGGVTLPRNLRGRVGDGVVDDGDLEIVRVEPDTALGGGWRDLSDDIAGADVTVVKRRADGDGEGAGDVEIRCPFDAMKARHVCAGLPEWMHVGVEALPVGGRTQSCTWAHPITGGKVVVRFAHVTLSSKLKLEVALTDGAADNKSGAAVTGVVRVDDSDVATLVKPPGKRGFVEHTAAIAGAPRDATVTLTITTPFDGQRHTCFRLTTGDP